MKNIRIACCLLLLPTAMAFSQSATTPGINKANMDLKTPPQQDFYRFVNGTWLDKTTIPADRTRWGSADELRQNTDRDMLEILEQAAKNPKYKPQTDQGKAIHLYKTIMDTVARNKQGLQPLQPKLAKIAAVGNMQDLQQLLIEEEPYGGIGFFNFSIGSDEKNSNRYIVELSPGRLGLPDRDYYVSGEKDATEKREKYRLHLERMLQKLGESQLEARAHAHQILAFEIALATPRLTRVERRDSRNTYNPMAVSDLQKLVPSINWKAYFAGNGLAALDSVIVSQPKYMAALEWDPLESTCRHASLSIL